MYEKVENIYVKLISEIIFGAKFYQELSQFFFSKEWVLNIKYLKKFHDKLSSLTHYKFHPDVLLTQSGYVQFHILKLTKFNSINMDNDEFEKQYISIRLCD